MPAAVTVADSSSSPAAVPPCDGIIELIATPTWMLWRDDNTPAHRSLVRCGKHRIFTDDPDQVLPRTIDARLPVAWQGKWEHTARGSAFCAVSFSRRIETNREGVIKYLMTVCPHVGSKTAERLWDAYGCDAVAVLVDDTPRVVADGHLSAEHAGEAAAAARRDSTTCGTKIALLGLFAKTGLTRQAITDCVDKWGDAAPDVVRRDPFTMLVTGVSGAGFLRCDALRAKLGQPYDRLKRRFLRYWAELARNSTGDVWHPAPPASVCSTRALTLGLRARWIERDAANRCALAPLAAAERRIAANIARLLAWQPCDGITGRTMWPASAALDATLSPHQRERVAIALSRPVGMLTGTPGTGKTFTAAAVLKAIMGTHPAAQIAVCAPTGKAAVRCAQALANAGVEGIETSTIHRLLGLDVGNNYTRLPLPTYQPLLGKTIVVVDEASMLDLALTDALCASLTTGTHVLLVGDSYQLPPVGAGFPLRDLIASGDVPVGELEEIRRNAGRIVTACRDIKDGKSPQFAKRYDAASGDNLLMVGVDDHEGVYESLTEVLERVAASTARGWHPVWSTQVIVPRNDGALGRHAVNAALQRLLNPVIAAADDADGMDVLATERPQGSPPFRLGDKVICLRNQRMPALREHPTGYAIDPAGATFVANGDLGCVEAVCDSYYVVRFTCPDRLVKVAQRAKANVADATDDVASDSGSVVSNGVSNGDPNEDVSLAYAITCHKMQGSEAPVVIVLLDPAGGGVADRSWIYTAISRARDLCILIGHESTLRRWVAATKSQLRRTGLTACIRAAVAAQRKGRFVTEKSA